MDYIMEIFIAMFGLNGNDRLYKEKVSALLRLIALIQEYERRQICGKTLLLTVAKKKASFICEAKTSGELDEILKTPKPYYNYSEVVPNSRFNIPEEELILWSWVSCSNTLVGHVEERYREVFKQVFPDFEIEQKGETIYG